LDICNSLRLGWARRSNGSRGRSGNLFGIERANLKLGLVFLQDSLIVILPELLGCIFTGNTLKDFAANFMLVPRP
jgi:hypothetical protein